MISGSEFFEDLLMHLVCSCVSSCDVRYLLWLEVTQVVKGRSIIESPAALKSDKFGNPT
jgi:hypothetical protein